MRLVEDARQLRFAASAHEQVAGDSHGSGLKGHGEFLSNCWHKYEVQPGVFLKLAPCLAPENFKVNDLSGRDAEI